MKFTVFQYRFWFLIHSAGLDRKKSSIKYSLEISQQISWSFHLQNKRIRLDNFKTDSYRYSRMKGFKHTTASTMSGIGYS